MIMHVMCVTLDIDVTHYVHKMKTACTLIQKRHAVQVAKADVCMLRQREKRNVVIDLHVHMYAAPTNNQRGCGGRAVEMDWDHITLDPEPDCVAVCA